MARKPSRPGRHGRTGTLPSREEILEFIRTTPGKSGKREIARAFGISGAARMDLKRLLRDMAESGEISGSRKRLRRPGDLPPVTVLVVEGIDDQGFPVAVPVEWNEAEGEAPRILVPPERSSRKTSRPAPGIGDRVLARLARDDALEAYVARVIKVLARTPRTALGIFRAFDGERRIVPVNRKGTEYAVPADATSGAVDGELVAAEEIGKGRTGLPAARVAERLGDVSSEKAVSLIALEEHGIPYRFPPEALAEAEAARPAGLEGRQDWRDLKLLTIDPSDARDHDDAVAAVPDPEGGHIVTVAIADVAWYVGTGSALDGEALNRGNSVYFPGRVVPMLPERISNDLCSLREGEDRPALAVRMRFAADGTRKSHRFHRITMRSAARLSYGEAQAAIDGSPDERTKPLVKDVLRPLWAAYRAVHKARMAREPLEINVPERKVLLNEDGSVDRVVVPPRLDAHRLIEEFMIQANVCAAETLEARRAPIIYRVHDEPSWDKLEALRDFLGSLDLSFPKGANLRPALFNRVLAQVADTEHQAIVNEVVLRTQSQAEYATGNIGHFGLNLKRYAHFTSPIRRYADLIVHRALIAALDLGEGGLPDGAAAKLDRVAGDISLAERRAMAAERDTVDRLIASWLADRVGARFAGRIRGVTRAGLFVELDETGADGFVPIGTLGADYFRFEEAHHRVVGRSSGVTFRLGDAVEVRLVEALPFAGSLRFEIEEGGSPARDTRRPKVERGRRRRARPERAVRKGGPRKAKERGR